MKISRVERSKSAARRAYNRMSRIYDLLAGSSEAQFIHLGLDMLAVRAGETVLEIGSGTGTALFALCQQAEDKGSVNGLDLSPGMLQVAHNRLAKVGLEGRAHLLIGDGAALPYSDQSFDALFMSFTLELFDTPEIPCVLAECHRVLQPGGRLGVVAMEKSEHPGWMERLYEWFHEYFPSYVDCRPIDAEGTIQAAGFKLEKRQVRSMWGLLVELVLARKG
jgi:demethylmenaquinone methyltransferase/2-methoxy-6-polyprenyl-1,4-benzoquinol methylase